MGERLVIPYICYEGEGSTSSGFHPARSQYVLWARHYKVGGAWREDWHLGYTGNDGKLRPAADDLISPTHNWVTIDKNPDGRAVFTVHNFKPVGMLKGENKPPPPVPVRLGAGEIYTIFIAPPSLLLFHSPSGIGNNILLCETVIKNNLVKGGQILRGRRNIPRLGLKKRERYWIPLPISYDVYLARMRKLIKKLDARLKAARKRLGEVMAAVSLVDYVGNLIAARQADAWTRWFLKLGGDIEKVKWSVVETRLMEYELIQPLKKRAEIIYKHRAEISKKRIDPVASELKRVIESPTHHRLYIQHFGDRLETDKIPRANRESYAHAYRLLSRTDFGPGIYNSHVKSMLSSLETKDKNGNAKKIESWAKTAAWVKSFRGEILDVVTAYGTLELSKQLEPLKYDLAKAFEFLDSKGLLAAGKTSEDLEDLLNDSIIHGRPVNSKEFFNLPDDSIGVTAFKGVVGAMAIANIMTKEHKTLADKIDSAKTVVGVGIDVTQVPQIASRFPKFAGVVKKGSVITAAADWGLSIHAMNKAADEGKATGFYTSVVSYGAKGVILGGTVLLFTPFAPLGLALVAIGGAVDLIGSAVEAAINYKSEKLRAFYGAMEKLKGVERSEMYTHYEVLMNKRADRTDYGKLLATNATTKRAMEKEWSPLFGSEIYRMKDMVEHYFSNPYFGVIDALN